MVPASYFRKRLCLTGRIPRHNFGIGHDALAAAEEIR
jgi:hypothetical protein